MVVVVGSFLMHFKHIGTDQLDFLMRTADAWRWVLSSSLATWVSLISPPGPCLGTRTLCEGGAGGCVLVTSDTEHNACHSPG